MKSYKGQLLVAKSDLRDPNFFHTVIILVQHNKDGALGLVLNRPSDTSVGEAWEEVSEVPCQTEAMLYHGGPCQGPLWAIHGDEEQSEAEIVPGVFLTSDATHLEHLVSTPPKELRLYAGYAGWGRGQLESEMREGSWSLLPAAREHLFASDDTLWEEVTKQVSGKNLLQTLKIKHVPTDLSAN